MKKNTEEEFIRIQDLWKMSVSKWHWFVISLAATLFISYIFISITSPIYTRTASILIKDNSKAGISSDDFNSFSDMGLFKSNTNINNEIFTFKSPLLMNEVVQQLKLNENYRIKGFFRDKVLYKDTPILVLFDSTKCNTPYSCLIELSTYNKVKISRLIFNGNDSNISETVEGTLSKPISTPWGNITIQPTPFYSEEYLDQQIFFSRELLASVVNNYTEALNVSLSDEKSTIVNVSLKDVSIRRAEDVLSTLIAVYNENWVKDKNQIANSTSLFIDERLNVIESELGNVDDNISKFKSQNLMPNVQVASDLYMAQSTGNNDKLLVLNTQQSIANYILSYLRNANTKDQLLPANLGIDNVGVEEQINEYNTALLRYNTLLANSSDKNPTVLDMNNSLVAMRKSIISSFENLLVALDTKIKDIQKSERQITERIASSPKQAKYLLSIERQQKIKEALYLFLLQKREENQLSQAFTAYNTKIIAPPSGSMFPTAPRKIPILIIATIIGLLLPLVVIFLIENFNTTVRGRKDLSALSLPFVGEIPQIITSKKEKFFKNKTLSNRDDIVVEEEKKDYMNEAFRVIRTNLDFMINTNEEKSRKVILMTSFNVGSGKTFSAINLAISMAIKGMKVVVVDLDMRKASLSTYVKPSVKGVSNFLGKMVDNIDEIKQKGTIHPNLDIIPVGTIPPNPAELLLNDRLSELLKVLKEQYDYIFLDCTPVEIVTDALIVGKFADLTLFVIRAGLMDRSMLLDVEEIYNKKQFNNMAVLLNGSQYVRRKSGYSRYGYAYGSSYH